MRIGLLALFLSILSSPLHAQGFLAQKIAGAPWPVEVVPVDTSGRSLTVWSRSGDEYIVATPGEFGLRFQNKTNAAMRIVVGMDGENLLDGSAWHMGGRGWIVPANATLLVKCDARGIPLRFSRDHVVLGQGSLRWAAFKERVWWAEPRFGAPLPPSRGVPPSRASNPQWEEYFHSMTPTHDYLGTLYYDQAQDLVLRGVIP